LDVPAPLAPEARAPDSIQFNLVGFEHDDQVRDFEAHAKARGVSVTTIGLAVDNARAFWNWEFIGEQSDLLMTREMLMRACDVRLPVGLDRDALDFIADTIVDAAQSVMTKTLVAV
jgi:hypothetical protein